MQEISGLSQLSLRARASPLAVTLHTPPVSEPTRMAPPPSGMIAFTCPECQMFWSLLMASAVVPACDHSMLSSVPGPGGGGATITSTTNWMELKSTVRSSERIWRMTLYSPGGVVGSQVNVTNELTEPPAGTVANAVGAEQCFSKDALYC